MTALPRREALLQGRVALVTGAGRGLGRAIALDLARHGARVVVSARSRDQIDAVAAEIGAAAAEAATKSGSGAGTGRDTRTGTGSESESGSGSGFGSGSGDGAGSGSAGGAGSGSKPRAVAISCDVTDAGSVEALVEHIVAAFGKPPDIVVNNAGAAESHKFAGHPDALWEKMIAVNLTGTYRVTRACAPGMLEAGWGRVINIGSIASTTGSAYIAAYTAAKHGVLGLTRALAAEWVRKGITVNLVAPGYVDTPMTDATISNIEERTGRSTEEATEAILRMSPQHRLVLPEEIAPLVRLLASEAGGSITGAVLPVDAGASAFPATG